MKRKHNDDSACATPLIELLQNVPEDARMTYEHHVTHHQMIPVGHLCHRSADCIKELEDYQTRFWEAQKIVLLLNAKLDAVKPLIQEIMDIHADPDMAEYNECDTDPCMWCEQAKAAIGEQDEH